MRSSVSKEKFDNLTKQQGYKNSKEEEDEEPQMALELVNMNMNEQITEAVKIAIINADNRGSHVLGTEDIEAVKRILRIFPPAPPNGEQEQHRVPVLVPPQVPQPADQKTKQKRVRNVGVKTTTKKIMEKKK